MLGSSNVVEEARNEIEQMANQDYTMDYLQRDEASKYDTYTPYVELLSNEDYTKMR
jgi:hypothetical protein